MKKIIIILSVIIGLIIILVVGSIYFQSTQKQDISELPDYYKNLTKECESKGSYNCCMSSVNNMADGNYKLASETGCPEEYQPNMLKCIDSFKWCEPIK